MARNATDLGFLEAVYFLTVEPELCSRENLFNHFFSIWATVIAEIFVRNLVSYFVLLVESTEFSNI